MTDSITTRFAVLEDSENLAGIMIAAWQSAFRDILSEETIAQYTQEENCKAMFCHILASGVGTMYLAALDHRPMGLLYWHAESEEHARIEALLTVPEAWGKGVGAALMGTALADMSAKGFRAVHVWPFAENHRAQRFYQKFGFTATGNTHQGDALEFEYLRSIP